MNGTAAVAVEGTMARVRLLAIAVLATAIILITPKVAMAANAYGQTFAGQQRCLENCHENTSGGWQVGTYVGTNHAKFVTDVQADPSALLPSASYWPSPAYGGGYSFAASDVKLMLGGPGSSKQYVTKYANSGSHLMGSGQTLNAVAGPADDLLSTGGTEWITGHSLWENLSKTTVRTYFQSCGGCHFLGVTRPSDVDYTLASGATMTHSTETSYSGFGIQCEHCHGTGKAGTHYNSGVDIVRTKASLDSQVCGQCHVNGTAKEKSYTAGTFSGANGYTPDKKLSDFFNVAGASYVQTSPLAAKPVIPTSDTKFYPDGSNKGMKHSYYNEWMLTPHARSNRWPDGTRWSPYAQDFCLRCHSTEGFLKSIGYGSSRFPNDVSGATSNLANDTLDIECGACHQVHASTGEPLGLRLDPEAICATCHNSLGPVGEELAPGATPHHPHREMRNGYGLIGVPTPAERFMEDTECPQCHMPTTKYTLKTHSMKPMLPGNADTWGVQAGGDSCTPCHASKTRAQLQGDIDEWKENLEDLIHEAEADVAAAESRAASTTVEGINLLGSAYTNIHFVEEDGSDGAHNYPYAKAGLEKAAYFARAVGGGFTRFGSTGYSGSMKMAMLYGTLDFGDGEAAAGEKVAIWAKPAESTAWAKIGTATTGEDGDFGYYVGPTGTTTYKAIWNVKRDVDVTSASSTVTLGSTTSTNVSAGGIVLGRYVKISGSVSPIHSGGRLTIQYKRGSGAWRTMTGRILNGGSAYTYGWRPTARGTYYVRSVFSGDAGHTGSTSSARKVVVR